MEHAIILHDYQGQSARAIVDQDIVDGLYLILRYTVSGDEVYMFITEDGEYYIFDAIDFIDNAATRVVSCGPENIQVIFPEEMQWVQDHAA